LVAIPLGKDDNRRQTAPLKETTNPEEKRKIIGDTFMHVSNDVIKVLCLGAAKFFSRQIIGISTQPFY
jgi:GMP synthase PP-ATPase subunit